VFLVTEDEVQLLATGLFGETETWEQVIRYGRLFTPGTALPDVRSRRPVYSQRNAYEHSEATGQLYVEGFAWHGFSYRTRGWCLDGEGDDVVVVEPTFAQLGTAYFGVVLRPEYMRRAYNIFCRDDDGSYNFRGVYTHFSDCPKPDPDVDMVHGLGRDIPASVREWALTAVVPRRGPQPEPPDWILDELRAL
jgi:hypothetical protein